jgi:tRNA dimethylallyltransferase
MSETDLEKLSDELWNLDPEYAAKVDLNNPHRVIRALSVCRQTGQPFSTYLTARPQPRPFTAYKFCLIDQRPILYERINQRVDDMITAGLEVEVEGLLPFRDHRALKTVGYQEFFDCFDGVIDRSRAIELIKQNSRRYAKRQITWFNNQGSWHMIQAADSKCLETIIKSVGS